jgi:hypothetical protein
MEKNLKRKDVDTVKPIPPSLFLYRPPDDTAMVVAQFLRSAIHKALQQKERLIKSPFVESVSVEVLLIDVD